MLSRFHPILERYGRTDGQNSDIKYRTSEDKSKDVRASLNVSYCNYLWEYTENSYAHGCRGGRQGRVNRFIRPLLPFSPSPSTALNQWYSWLISGNTGKLKVKICIFTLCYCVFFLFFFTFIYSCVLSSVFYTINEMKWFVWAVNQTANGPATWAIARGPPSLQVGHRKLSKHYLDQYCCTYRAECWSRTRTGQPGRVVHWESSQTFHNPIHAALIHAQIIYMKHPTQFHVNRSHH